ncbi:hypothetical protein [Endozoicomonas ascidiicola]|uniref:hypothetical protein n=1 Tax=Endozoicomonas ascidiicola TaxID=1698521 RepID=UPI000831D071|nr:hypothetical protein [Endozoicomonas ascidiicola]
MDYHPKIELGQIIQTVGSIFAAILACAFAYAFLVKDVEFTNKELRNTKEAVAVEAQTREKEDQRLRLEFEAESQEIKEEIKAVEYRQRFLLDDMRNDIKYLVRDRRDNEQSAPPK